MGLEIYYDIHAPADWTAERVVASLERVRAVALEQGFAEVHAIVEGEEHSIGMKDPPETGGYPTVKSSEGWHFVIWPGPRCETAWFGLHRYPADLIAEDDAPVPTGWGEGWHYHTWCKTQYADRVSREHFLRCHCGLIAVLDACRAEGLETNVRDGSGYWDHRQLSELIASLDEWNGIVAAVAGAMKDAFEDQEMGGELVSPIFANADFERLELEGRQSLCTETSEEGDDLPRS